jgi:hypothetical protein
MSLETALADNTAALRELHALLARLNAAPAELPDAPKPQARSAAPTAPSSPTAEVAPAAAPETSEPAAPATYDDVKRAIIEVSKAKGRDAAVALLAEFGAAKGPDLQPTPDKFAPFVARAAELLK